MELTTRTNLYPVALILGVLGALLSRILYSFKNYPLARLLSNRTELIETAKHSFALMKQTILNKIQLQKNLLRLWAFVEPFKQQLLAYSFQNLSLQDYETQYRALFFIIVLFVTYSYLSIHKVSNIDKEDLEEEEQVEKPKPKAKAAGKAKGRRVRF